MRWRKRVRVGIGLIVGMAVIAGMVVPGARGEDIREFLGPRLMLSEAVIRETLRTAAVPEMFFPDPELIVPNLVSVSPAQLQRFLSSGTIPAVSGFGGLIALPNAEESLRYGGVRIPESARTGVAASDALQQELIDDELAALRSGAFSRERAVHALNSLHQYGERLRKFYAVLRSMERVDDVPAAAVAQSKENCTRIAAQLEPKMREYSELLAVHSDLFGYDRELTERLVGIAEDLVISEVVTELAWIRSLPIVLIDAALHERVRVLEPFFDVAARDRLGPSRDASGVGNRFGVELELDGQTEMRSDPTAVEDIDAAVDVMRQAVVSGYTRSMHIHVEDGVAGGNRLGDAQKTAAQLIGYWLEGLLFAVGKPEGVGIGEFGYVQRYRESMPPDELQVFAHHLLINFSRSTGETIEFRFFGNPAAMAPLSAVGRDIYFRDAVTLATWLSRRIMAGNAVEILNAWGIPLRISDTEADLPPDVVLERIFAGDRSVLAAVKRLILLSRRSIPAAKSAGSNPVRSRLFQAWLRHTYKLPLNAAQQRAVEMITRYEERFGGDLSGAFAVGEWWETIRDSGSEYSRIRKTVDSVCGDVRIPAAIRSLFALTAAGRFCRGGSSRAGIESMIAAVHPVLADDLIAEKFRKCFAGQTIDDLLRRFSDSADFAEAVAAVYSVLRNPLIPEALKEFFMGYASAGLISRSENSGGFTCVVADLAEMMADSRINQVVLGRFVVNTVDALSRRQWDTNELRAAMAVVRKHLADPLIPEKLAYRFIQLMPASPLTWGFSDISGVLDAVRDILRDHGISLWEKESVLTEISSFFEQVHSPQEVVTLVQLIHSVLLHDLSEAGWRIYSVRMQIRSRLRE